MTPKKPASPSANSRTPASKTSPLAHAVLRLETALSDLHKGASGTRQAQLNTVYATLHEVLAFEGGLKALADRGDRFASAGVFDGGPWFDPERLLPQLVGGGLLADDKTAAVEMMSELRMLAIANERLKGTITAEEAREFLREVIVLNMGLLSPSGSEAERARPEAYARARTFLLFLLGHLSPSLMRDAFVAELDALCAQRPIITQRARTLIERASLLPGRSEHASTEKRLQLYQLAVGQPSPLSQTHPDTADYQQALKTLDEAALDHEVRSFASSLRLTGLGNPYHALLLRHLIATDPARIGPALGLNAVGEATLQQQLESVVELVQVSIHPETCDAIYGLAGLLERGLLCRRAVIKGFQRLASANLHPSATKGLMEKLHASSSVNANALLLAGAISVLGQPLGIGQGNNPTCQSARAVSLWSLHAPGYLLNLLIRAASDGAIQLDFEGAVLQSDQLTGGLATTIQADLDPVSAVLVPHLDRLYDAMAKRALGRGVDLHRWVNPALYGRWVPLGFACAIDDLTHYVTRYDEFIRRFYATHHPSFNDGDDLMYPNPVGILVTDAHGRMLGPHAVSLLRVEPDLQGEMRAYFFNPNNEGRQVWGPHTVVSVSGNGEVPGESSLPFARFAARLYAFHYHTLEGGDLDAVPDSLVVAVEEDSRQSWGRSYQWVP